LAQALSSSRLEPSWGAAGRHLSRGPAVRGWIWGRIPAL